MATDRAEKLKIFDIQRTCIHDGPGIRTTIFFQGCRLRCLWCQNLEGLSFNGNGGTGRSYSLAEAAEVVIKDKDYYFSSNGGITISGGEPLLQDTESLLNLLKLLKKEKIKVAAETSLHAPWENISGVAPYIDLFLVDLKIVGDDELHKEYTKQDGRLILKNIRKLPELNTPVRFRMVMVPGYTDSERNIRAASDLLKSMGHDSIELLQYHNLYEKKAERLGLDYVPLHITPQQSLISLKEGVDLFKKYGIKAESTYLDSTRPRAIFTRRVKEIQKAIRECKPAVCIEDSLLKTEYYAKHAFVKPYKKRVLKKPAPVHRAESLAYVLQNKKIKVYPQELLVGNFTAERVGGRAWTEYLGMLAVSQLLKANRRKPVAFRSSFKDLFAYATKVMPKWMEYSHFQRLLPDLPDLRLMAARTTEWNVGMNFNLIGIGHYIANFETVLKLGTTGLIKEVRAKQKEKPENDQNFYEGAVIALQGLEAFAQRYAGHLSELSRKEDDPERRAELEAMAGVCRRVPAYPARTFHEALQSILFVHIALCLEANENAISFGRLDQILYPYYKKDIEEKRITYEKAKELLCLFVLKMDELVLVNNGENFPELFKLFETISTDQAITFGGVDKDGRDATNDLTYMLVDACELQPRSADPAARIHKDSPPEYLERLAEVYAAGTPLPQLFNDEIYIETLLKHYPTTLEEARNYAIVGCVEPVASDDHFGNTDCANMNLALPFLQALKGHEYDLWNYEPSDQRIQLATNFVMHLARGKGRLTAITGRLCRRVRERHNQKKGLYNYNPPSSMDELLERFQARLNHLTASVLADQQEMEKDHRENFPTPLASSLYRGCLERGKDATAGGTTFNSCGIQALGVTDVADSLHALDEVVFRKKLYDIEEIIIAMDNNFAGEGQGKIREALLAVPKFGDDSSHEAVEWVNKVMEIYNNALDAVGNCPRNGRYAAGYYALNVGNIYGKNTQALPSGRLKGVPFANSITPHYGMKQSNLFSALNSITGVNFVDHAENGVTATLTVDSGLFSGEEGIKNLAGIFKTFMAKGGMQLQPNIIDREVLQDAYENPEKYPDLMIRIAGYCEYFANLSDEMKRDVINRSCYG